MANTTQNPGQSSKIASCLVIGGGISGLIASQVLQGQGIDVTVLDKGRGIGGRLATRRISSPDYGQGIFDYGVQHFPVSAPKFKELVDSWIKIGLVKKWSDGFYTADGHYQKSNEAFYCGVKSNRSIAQYLAQDLDVRTQTRIVELQCNKGQWVVKSQKGDSFKGNNLLLTAPVPQSLELLDNSGIGVPLSMRHSLEQLTYYCCIAVLALLDQPSQIPEPGGLWLEGQPLAWIGCNHQKGISPEAYAVTIHASYEFSLANWEVEREIVGQQLIDLAQHYLGAKVVNYQVHGWKFSQPKTYYREPYAAFPNPGNLVLAGDAFSSQRNLEGAVLSGLAAAEYIVGLI